MQTTAKSAKLAIEGMSGDACVRKVEAAIKSVPGVTADSVKVGSATIGCETQQQCDSCCSAITAAGYKAKEASGNAGSNAGSNTGSNASSNASSNDGKMNRDNKAINDGNDSDDGKANHDKANHDKANYDNKANHDNKANNSGYSSSQNKKDQPSAAPVASKQSDTTDGRKHSSSM